MKNHLMLVRFIYLELKINKIKRITITNIS
jgi:hypothetical protein